MIKIVNKISDICDKYSGLGRFEVRRLTGLSDTQITTIKCGKTHSLSLPILKRITTSLGKANKYEDLDQLLAVIHKYLTDDQNEC